MTTLKREYKEFNLTLKIPIVNLKSHGLTKEILMESYDVSGMVRILENLLCDYIANKKQIAKSKDKSRFEEAEDILKEYFKFKLMESFGVKEYPISNKI